ncbi:uncharacterized protein LOC134537741 isoform X3 [Bacillus rossius redtenbacheri]
MQMEYSSLVPQYSAPSSVSSASGSCEGRASRLRAVRLSRRAAEDAVGRPPSFGFSLRGGREHGTGFFVSAVEPGSEAHCRGLRVGDQIVRLNGFPLEDAIHREVLQLIQNQNFLTLKVRTVGMIPVKDKRSDPLTWRVVEEDDTPPTRPPSESSAPCQDDHHRDVRLLLTVPPRSKLGCGICKGPDWKPGIFVQFTKDNGIAKEVGLRPGDQVLQCNGITFRDITFSDAVHVLKSSRQLDLVIRKGAGLDLFPGESSGYNSSASSVNGDQSPSWEDTKRLSVVKEESMELEERLGQLETARGGTLDKDKQWDQIEYEWNKAERTEDARRIGSTLRSTTSTLKPSGASCTMIRVEENDAATTNGETKDVNESVGWAEIRLVSQQQETTTVVVEVHRSEEGAAPEEGRGSDASPQQLRFSRPPAPPEESKCTNLSKSPSSSSFASLASSAASSSLSSAISQELLRRSQKREEDSTQKGDDCKKEILKRINNEKRQQHEQLMEEFKRAHRKMFAHAVPAQVVSEDSADGSEQDRESPDHRRRENVPPAVGSAEQAPVEAAKERELRPSKVQETATTERDKKSSLCQPPPPPPPPPPMPADEGDSTPKRPVPLPNGNASPPSCPTPDYDTASTRSSSSYSPTPSLAGGGVGGPHPPPPPAARPAAGGRGGEGGRVPDSVEMESLESFTLNNPALPDPKPPSTYFSSLKARKDSQSSSFLSSSSSTPLSSKDSSLKRTSPKARPVSVTIGEYPSGMERKMPSKFNFLSGSTADVSRATLNPASGGAPITSQLQSELVQTLSRSNLRKRTERLENLKGSTETTNGTVIIPVNSQPSVKSNSLSCNTTSAALLSSSGSLQMNHVPSKKPIVTSNSKPCNIFQMLPDNKSHISSSAKPAIRDAAEKIANTFANNNRLTIKVANGTANTTAVNKQKDAIVDSKTKENINETPVHPNGILKNGTNFAWQNSKQPHATIVHQKSITFGKKTTIISDVAVSEN